MMETQQMEMDVLANAVWSLGLLVKEEMKLGMIPVMRLVEMVETYLILKLVMMEILELEMDVITLLVTCHEDLTVPTII